jgi:uncharacterized repeat protein (TIGR03803 family)
MARVESHRVSALALLVLIAVFAATPGYAQNFSVLYEFGSRSGDPTAPYGFVAQGRDGSLYSTSFNGGANGGTNGGDGAVFKITPAGQERVLYSFCSQTNCSDGESPQSGLTLRADGHFLGAASTGGSQGFGTIFDISPTGSLTTLYNFTGGKDGGFPAWPPILGTDGTFYGTTPNFGAPSGCGTIYGIAGGVFSLLHQFDGSQGCNPNTLVLATDGSFYGTTVAGGTTGNGVFFRVTVRPGKSTLVTVLYNFDGLTLANPQGPLVQGSDGNFYGTTVETRNLSSEIFKITPSGVPSILHTMSQTDGTDLFTGLVQATDGNFYGAATRGGNTTVAPCNPAGCGTLFQVTPAGGFSVLYTFDFTTGAGPSTPVQHTNGLLYGDTGGGGINSRTGVFYSWDAGLSASVSFVPDRGKVASFVEILGQGFTSSTTVSFNGTPATATVVSGTYLKAVVPSGATTGFVTVATSTGTLTSNKQFIVIP